ncbi:MAG: 1,2-phenylacetyl-CoA epoxidase subunit PaaD [Polaromonas sp.]|uniref:1,2-phenylacetyl-CoA epoxidase subunit PaaD n=1 Tax=Polaromonas sp. TaxID=1869339 RepID=UPI002732598A|nr:1,2-phenylacetyl-CoA epoxidase subunit PaaD [Polaromonas sp.]MDP2819056.1 1,2-phenylacetyl-CoA epoxidase subunit PaaD [Polaromonas sp.]
MNTVQAIWDALEAVPDPEIPVVSLRELGILRDVRHTSAGVEIIITPTYSGCPAMGQIEDDIHAVLAQQHITARITTQLAPAWTTDWISPATKEKLRSYGIAPPHTTTPDSDRVIRFTARKSAVDAVACPQCGSVNTTETSHFGSTACKALYKCLDCLEPFDYFKSY